MKTNKIFRNMALIAVTGILLSSCSPKTQYINTWYKQDTVKTKKIPSADGMFYDNKSGILYKI